MSYSYFLNQPYSAYCRRCFTHRELAHVPPTAPQNLSQWVRPEAQPLTERSVSSCI